MNYSFEGIWIPIVTPFQQGKVDYPALRKLACYLAVKGVNGLVLGATTGEGAFLTIEEQLQMADCLSNALPANFPLVIGLNGMDTQATARHARRLAAAAPAGLLVTAPPYVRPSQQGLQCHFETIADAANLPLIIYDIPYRSGVELEFETLLALSRNPLIRGIKSCGASVDRLMQLIHDTPLQVLIGEDSQFFAALTMGADGAIAASAHYRPELWVRIYQLIQNQELNAARALAAPLQPMIRAMFTEPNPAPVKAWLSHIGMIENELRLPFLPARAATLLQLKSLDDCLNQRQVW